MRRADAVGLVLSALVAVGGHAWADTVAEDQDGLFFDVQPVTLDGRCLVPIRPIFEWLGARVVYEGGTIKAFRSSAGVVPQVELGIGETEARISGAPYELDVPPQTIEGRTFVPLRFVAESFGVWVEAKGPQMILSIPQENRSAVMAIPPHPQAHLGKMWRIVQLWYDVVPRPKDAAYPHWSLYAKARQEELELELGADAVSTIEVNWGARHVEGIRVLGGRVSPGAKDGWVEVLVKYADAVEKERLEFVAEPEGWRVRQLIKE